MSTTPATDFDELPPHDLLRIEITKDDRVLVDGWEIEAPEGDLRAAAVNAAADYAERMGHPVRVVITTPDGQATRMIASPGARVEPRPATPLPPVEPPPERTRRVALPASARAAVRALRSSSQQPAARPPQPALQQLYALLAAHPQPPEDFAAGDVPAWPTLRIVLTGDDRATVEGRPVAPIAGVTVREVAVATAAAHAQALGLTRPVRAVATDPDGTQWPLIVHPNGSASAGAGDPIRPPKKRGRRDKDQPQA